MSAFDFGDRGQAGRVARLPPAAGLVSRPGRDPAGRRATARAWKSGAIPDARSWSSKSSIRRASWTRRRSSCPSGARRCRSGRRTGTLRAGKSTTRPARPHLANTGMQDFFRPGPGPARGPGNGRGCGLSGGGRRAAARRSGSTASLALPDQRPAAYPRDRRRGGHAVGRSAGRGPAANWTRPPAYRLANLKAEHQAWWRDYWGRSFLQRHAVRTRRPIGCARVPRASVHAGLREPRAVSGEVGRRAGTDARRRAELGAVGMGPGDPLHLSAAVPANRLDMARGLTRHYSAMVPYLRGADARRCGDCPACGFPKRCCPGDTPRISCCRRRPRRGGQPLPAPRSRDRSRTGRFDSTTRTSASSSRRVWRSVSTTCSTTATAATRSSCARMPTR